MLARMVAVVGSGSGGLGVNAQCESTAKLPRSMKLSTPKSCCCLRTALKTTGVFVDNYKPISKSCRCLSAASVIVQGNAITASSHCLCVASVVTLPLTTHRAKGRNTHPQTGLAETSFCWGDI